VLGSNEARSRTLRERFSEVAVTIQKISALGPNDHMRNLHDFSSLHMLVAMAKMWLRKVIKGMGSQNSTLAWRTDLMNGARTTHSMCGAAD